jgi:WD40 repeat protein
LKKEQRPRTGPGSRGRPARVFVSYSSRNRKLAKAVQRSLEGAGFEVWRDQRRIENDWSAEIAAALGRTDLLCLLWTEDSAKSDWVKNEWLTARALEKLIVPCLFPSAPKLPRPIENLQGIPFPNLAAGLRKLTAHLRSQTAFQRKYDFRAPPLRGYVPFAPDDSFVGREDDLREIYQSLIGQLNKIGVSQVGAVGMGGVGKTELAVAFAHRFGFAFEGVYWIQGTAADGLGAAFVRLARELLGLRIDNPNKADADGRYILELYSYLKKHPQVLVIVDNLADPDCLTNPSLLPGGRLTLLDLCGNLLFTTRRRFSLTGVAEHQVKVLAPEAASALLDRARAAVTAGDRVHAQDIANAVGYLPLALALIGGYLRIFPQISYGRYLAVLRQRGLSAIDTARLGAGRLATRHQAAVGATLHGQWTALRDRAARLVLKLAGHLPEGAIIPAARIGLLAGRQDRPAALELPLARAINRLQQLNLIGAVEDGAAVRVHPLVARFVRDLVPARSRSTFLREAAGRVKTAYADPWRLKAEHQARGVDQVIEDLELAVSWTDRRHAADGELPLLRRLLDRERQHLRPPAQTSLQPRGALFQQLHQRAAILGSTRLAAKFLRAGLRDGQAMLRVRGGDAREDLARVRTFVGHGSVVTRVAVSADGRRLLTASGDRRVILWDLASGQILRILKGHKSMVAALAISPDGRRALSGGWDARLICWDLETGQRLWEGRHHRQEIGFIDLTADGQKALSGFETSMIVWDVASGRKVARLKSRQHRPLAGALSRDGRLALSGGLRDEVMVWDVQRECQLYSFQLVPGANGIVRDLRALCFSPDAKLAAVADGYGGATADYWGPDRDGRLFLWDLEARRFIRTFTGHAAPINALAFSRDGARLLSGSADKTLKLWDVRSGRCQRTLVGHTREVTAAAFTAGERGAVSGGWDMNAILWELGPRSGVVPSTPRRRRSSGHSLWVRSAHLSADGRLAATGSDDGGVVLWSAGTGRPLRTLEGHAERVNSVKLSDDGSRAVSGDHGGTVIVWDTAKAQPVSTIQTRGGRVHAVNFSPDRRMVLWGSWLGRLSVWDLEQERRLQSFEHREKIDVDGDDDIYDGITAIAVSHDGEIAVSADERSKKLFLWDLAAVSRLRGQSAANQGEARPARLQRSPPAERAVFKGHSKGVLALDHDRSAGRVLSGSDDQTAILWDTRSQRPLRRLEGHSRPVNGVALASGRRAVTTSWDSTLIVWDLESGQAILRSCFDSPLCAVAAHGTRVMAGDVGGAVYFFDLEEPKEERLRRRVR